MSYPYHPIIPTRYRFYGYYPPTTPYGQFPFMQPIYQPIYHPMPHIPGNGPEYFGQPKPNNGPYFVPHPAPPINFTTDVVESPELPK